MKKYLYLLLMLCCALSFTACDDDDDDPVIDEEWKALNEQKFKEIAANPEYAKCTSISNPDVIIYKKILKEGNGKKIFYNSRVDTYYKGWLVDGTLFNSYQLEDGKPFAVAVSSAVSNYVSSTDEGYRLMIQGWSVALQYMTEGEIAEIWIPQKYAYGETASTIGTFTMPAYSTLKFEVEAVKAYTYGVDF